MNRAINDKVAKGSNPQFSNKKGNGTLRAPSVVKKSKRTVLRKVAIKSGLKKAVGRGTKKVNTAVKSTRQTYPSKRVLAIMDANERPKGL